MTEGFIVNGVELGAAAHVVDEHVHTGFEGPEKRLEIDFKKNANNPEGLRVLSKDQWQEMLNFAKCTIIGHTSNKYFDSFVLSESSLFVYPFKIMLKTCGTTTLLKCIPKLMEYASSLDLSIEFVMFSRKNFLFPCQQAFPHSDWNAEVDYLNQIFDGTAFVLGPLTQEHWHLYLADYSDTPSHRLCTSEKTLEIMMHNLDRDVAKQFYRREGQVADKEKFPGMADIIPDSVSDEFNFAPCGYSMNGLNGDTYYTIHVTPEPHCSYASFETNISLPSYKDLISKVLDIFKPGSLSLTLFYEKCTGDEAPRPFDSELPGYVVKHKTLSEVEGDCEIIFVNYQSVEYANRRKACKSPPNRHRQPQD
jgi:S-adenosylmethionine decarboxylase